jgi:Protein of unknown function (DUF3618)
LRYGAPLNAFEAGGCTAYPASGLLLAPRYFHWDASGTPDRAPSYFANSYYAASSWSIFMATQAEARSLSEFEREAEHTRADLIHTVDELHHRVSAPRIKEEVKAYARDSGQEFIRSLERRARENPLQTVAVAAGLVYPAWRLLMNMPVPVLLVGAGLALAGKDGMPLRRSYTPGGAESFADTAQRRMQDASSAASETLSGMKEKAVGAAEDAKTAAISGMSAVTERAASMANEAMSAASDAMSSARDAGADTLSAAQETLSGTYQSAADAIARSPAQLTETWRRSSNTLAQTIEAHPFVWGAVGLVAGAVIASALPVTQAENQLFGETNEHLKQRATDLANRSMQVATEAAQDIYQDAVTRAKEHGVDADVVRDTIRHAGEKVSGVVEQASNALKENEAPSTPQSTSNIKPNIGD